MRKVFLVTAVTGLISFLYYGPFLDNFFVWDDFWVLENADGGFYNAFFGYGNLRVVGNFFVWLEYLISGLNPIGYSLINVFTHIANTLLLYALLKSLLSDKYLPSIAAIIFSGLAVFADAILWRAAYLTLTNFSFYIIVLYLYVGWRKNNKQGYRILSLVAFSLGMFNKEEIASVPFMIILIECMFFEGRREIPALAKRILPYFIVIVLYVVLSFTLPRLFGIYQEQFQRFFGFRPLHTLLSGFTAFFISPEGRLSWSNPLMYITAILMPLSIWMVKDKKLLLFGYLWVFVTFLPQSLTMLTRYDVPYLFNSISRHLYIPSAGVAMVFALCLHSLKERMRMRYLVLSWCLLIPPFVYINYNRVQSRGNEWRIHAEPMKRFLSSIKKVQPRFPKNSYIHVVDPPTGRAYIQRSLRGFYKNPDIFWVDDPDKVVLKEGESFFIIFHNWGPGEAVRVWKVK